MPSEPDDTWYFFDELDAQPLFMIGAKGDAVVSQAQTQSNGGVPTVRTGDKCAANVVYCRFHFESSKGRDKIAVVVDRHAVALTDAKCPEQHTPTSVESIREVCFGDSCGFFHSLVSQLRGETPSSSVSKSSATGR